MKTYITVTLAMFAGFGLGAVAVQGIHAQAKPPVYQITEIVPDNMATYVKDYVPRAQAAIKAAGGRLLAGGTATAVEGDPPKPRVAITAWDSSEKFQAYRNSAAFKELVPTRDKLAKFRSFTVEGLPNCPTATSCRIIAQCCEAASTGGLVGCGENSQTLSEQTR
jgi:uncharacterized protein (DUF1330 family)